MHAPLWTKIGMGIGFAIIALFAMVEVSNIVFDKPELEQHAYVPEGVEQTEHIASDTQAAETSEAAEDTIDLAALLAAADVDAGEKSTKGCKACHTLTKGGKDGIGPNLWDIVGRAKASVEGYKYSKVLKGLGGTWGYDDLNAFLTKPSAYAKGNKMSWPGERSDKKRANLIAYLRTLSDTPMALPAVEAVEEVVEEAADAVDEAAETVEDTTEVASDAATDAADEAAGAVEEKVEEAVDATEENKPEDGHEGHGDH